MAIVPVVSSLDSYAQEIQRKFYLAGFQVDCDLDPGTTLNKKIRSNQLAQYNFIGGNIRNIVKLQFKYLLFFFLFKSLVRKKKPMELLIFAHVITNNMVNFQ